MAYNIKKELENLAFDYGECHFDSPAVITPSGFKAFLNDESFHKKARPTVEFSTPNNHRFKFFIDLKEKVDGHYYLILIESEIFERAFGFDQGSEIKKIFKRMMDRIFENLNQFRQKGMSEKGLKNNKPLKVQLVEI
ncbi:MAG: hypothetical protein EBR02_05285 [Alphaproteobacteria bacterium]|nr:hypothetical protein [Alphaproteobacteria bacterium]